MGKKLYITKQANNNCWHYIGDPLNPTSTMDTGTVNITKEEIKVDDWGAYVVRSFSN